MPSDTKDNIEYLKEFGKTEKWKNYEGKVCTFDELTDFHLINIVDHVSKLPLTFSAEFRKNVLEYALKIRCIPYETILKGQAPHTRADGKKALIVVDEENQKASIVFVEKPASKKRKNLSLNLSNYFTSINFVFSLTLFLAFKVNSPLFNVASKESISKSFGTDNVY